jgi:hypothetical protein
MYVNWWDNPTNPDSWHKHQVGDAAAVRKAACQDKQLQLLHLSGGALAPYADICSTLSAGKTQSNSAARLSSKEQQRHSAVRVILLHVAVRLKHTLAGTQQPHARAACRWLPMR